MSAGSSRGPDEWLWGVAASAYQVEGGIHGNDWDMFTTAPQIRRRVRRRGAWAGQAIELTPAGAAIGHQDLGVLEDDLRRAVSLGMTAYRFSVEWSRIQPVPPGPSRPLDATWDPAALRYYGDVVALCRDLGVAPVVTLNHFTLPAWVLTPPRAPFVAGAFDAAFRRSLGGWENARTVAAYLTFVDRVVRTIGADVRHWITLNEPMGVVALGYLAGIWPPGFVLSTRRARRSLRRLVQAHASAYELIKRLDANARVGLAHAFLDVRPDPPRWWRPARAGSRAAERFDHFYNWRFLDAAVGAARRADFIGVNYYRAVDVRPHPLVSAFARSTGGVFDNDPSARRAPGDGVLSDLGWRAHPAGLGAALRRAHARYGLPLLVTENGFAERQDGRRAAYLLSHLREVERAVAGGVDVRGYLVWSLADNYEWQEGYRPASRFGIFTVDREQPALPRRLTASAWALRSVTAGEGIRDAADRFGAMTADGRRLIAPRRSPGRLWVGAVDGAGISLLLGKGAGGLTGLLCLHESRLWVALASVTWTPGEALLRFSHRAAGAVAARRYQATVDGDALTGTHSGGGAWSARRALPFGTWQGAPAFSLFSGMEPGAPWQGTVLEGRWDALEQVTCDGATLTIEHGGATFAGAIVGERIAGEVRTRTSGRPLAWTARRAPDDLPF